MTTKLEKMHSELQNKFRDALHAAFYEKHNAHLTTQFNIFTMRLTSEREDRQEFTPEQLTFIEGWSEGFGKAMAIVQMRDSHDEYDREMRQRVKEAV